MSFPLSRRLLQLSAVASLFAVVACSDDDPVEPPAPALVAPSGLAGTATSPNTIDLTWSAATGATSYTVEQATGSGAFALAGTVSATNLSVTNLTPNTQYRFRVRALRNAELGPFSTEVTVSTPPATPTALTAPTGLAGTSPSSSSIRVTWNAVATAGAYDVQRATTGGTFVSVDTVAGLEHTSSGLASGTDYRFRVRALRGTETGPFSGEVTVRTAAASTVQVTADITTNTTWTANNVYQLTRIISVANGATLTIQPGTRIIGGPITAGQAPPLVALMVLRGSRINAVGTAENPIVMTSSAPEGERRPGDWGGLIIVGNARSNRTGVVKVEGPTPADTVTYSGGNLDNDNSGELRYVRVEFAGAAVQTGVELNAFSFYAVGNSTRMEYLQAIRGLDDQFEWFGGTVDSRYLVSYESGDDHFDAAEGHRGRHQFLIALQTGPRVQPRPGNPGALASDQNGFEVDGCAGAGCTDGFNTAPFSMPVFANFTMVGPGPGVLPQRPAGDGGVGLLARRGTGGVWVNGVVARWPEAGLSVFDPETDTRITQDSLAIRNIVLADNNRTYDAVGASNRFGQESKFTNNNNRTSTAAAHTLFVNVPEASTTTSPANNFAFDWRPATGSILTTGGTGATLPGLISSRVNNYFGGTLSGTTYIGAVDPAATTPWYAGWTRYYAN